MLFKKFRITRKNCTKCGATAASRFSSKPYPDLAYRTIRYACDQHSYFYAQIMRNNPEYKEDHA